MTGKMDRERGGVVFGQTWGMLGSALVFLTLVARVPIVRGCRCTLWMWSSCTRIPPSTGWDVLVFSFKNKALGLQSPRRSWHIQLTPCTRDSSGSSFCRSRGTAAYAVVAMVRSWSKRAFEGEERLGLPQRVFLKKSPWQWSLCRNSPLQPLLFLLCKVRDFLPSSP